MDYDPQTLGSTLKLHPQGHWSPVDVCVRFSRETECRLKVSQKVSDNGGEQATKKADPAPWTAASAAHCLKLRALQKGRKEWDEKERKWKGKEEKVRGGKGWKEEKGREGMGKEGKRRGRKGRKGMRKEEKENGEGREAVNKVSDYLKPYVDKTWLNIRAAWEKPHMIFILQVTPVTVSGVKPQYNFAYCLYNHNVYYQRTSPSRMINFP